MKYRLGFFAPLFAAAVAAFSSASHGSAVVANFGRRRSAAFQCVIAAVFVLGLAFGDSSALAAIGNAWHIPDSTELGSPVRMRFQEFFFGPNDSFDVYNGNQFQGGGNFGDQSGGTVYFKGVSENLAVGSWHSAPLNFYQQSGNNKYWKATINTTGISGSDPILYYLRITYADGHEPTFLYGSDAASNASASETTAAGSPFSVRNRAAFIFHANNRVVLPGADVNHNDVQFWAKIGYINRDTAGTQWTDHACVYYTVDGSAPAGALGVGTGTTQVAVMHYDHEENDPSPAGNAMWWFGTAANLPNFTIQPANTSIRYKIGVWNSSNNEEKFADYNAGAANTTFQFTIGTVGDPSLTVNGVEANYTTTHTFINEVTPTSTSFSFYFSPNDPQTDPSTVQLYTNLNRRDYATQKYTDVNGLWTEEGINPPSGDLVSTDDSHYYKAYPMSGSLLAGFTTTLSATKTGAYRVTARYKRTLQNTWIYYNSGSRRDHAIVVSPDVARNIVMYELNAMTVESQGTQSGQRSTFTDLYDGPNARAYNSVTTRFNLNYLANLGVNWVWFQPIHPCGFNGRQIDPDTGQIFEVGSPYAVKNFFEVSPLLAKSYTPSAIYNPNDPGENAGRAAAMTEFQGFVAAADTAGVSVMLDAPFNHTSYDSELSGAGVTYISPGADPRSLLTSIDTRVYSRNADYCQRATLASGQGPAVAPDRGDFGKFADVYDVFFGRYSALVCQNPSDNGNYLNESDSFFYTDSNWTSVDRTITIDGGNHNINVTQNMWKFFSDYVLFWLDQTGCPAGTSVADQAYKGIDGLRADFGQGLPPQCWEYIINKARTRKWAFVFMSESLDGGAVTYRSGRHFDVLNENIVFPYQQAANATDYRNIYENRRNAYGQALVLMNNTSHDEENYQDPYQALIRYMTAGTIDGAPMIFMGQELGVSRTFGFDRYETNFGKQIAHFKKYNSMQPIFAPVNRTYALDQLYPVYAAIGQARAFSRALRSSNRYFVDQIGGGAQPNIFSVAKYETANASPNYADVVFGFVNLDRNNNQQGSFNVNITQNGSNLFGIKAGRTYNVKNIAAYTAIDNTRRDQYLIPGNISGTNLLNNGLFVLLKKVPALDSGWSTDPFEAQYLKLYDVTPPPVPNAPTTPAAYAVGHTVVFNWAAVSDPDGGILGYNLSVGTAPGTHDVFGPTFVGNVTTYSISNVPYGVTLYASIGAVSNAGVSGLSSMSSAPVVVLDPSADSDHDGVSNMDEVAAGTNPLDPNSVFRITGITRPDPTHVSVTWSSVNGKQYVIQSAGAPGGTYVDVPGSLISAGGPSTSETISGTMPVYYRVRIGP